MDKLDATVTEHSLKHYEVMFNGCEIYYIKVINFWLCDITTAENELRIRLAGLGEFHTEDKTFYINVQELSTLTPLDRLVGTNCLRLEALETGWLVAEFSNGDVLRLPPDEQYENWEFYVNASECPWLIGSNPGGGVWAFKLDQE